MKILLLIVLVLLGQNVVKSSVNDRLRDFMMDLSIFNRADLDLGLAMEVVGIRLLGYLPRISLWSMKAMNVKIVFDAPQRFDDISLVESIDYPTALQMLINVEIPEGTYAGIQNTTGRLLKTDAIPNYLQGILLTCLFALVPLLLTLCCCCFVGCGCCDGLIKCLNPCCRCNVRWKSKMMYNCEYRFKCCLQCCLKCEWCVFILFVMIVMFFWGYFSYLSHVGVSQAMDTFRNDTDTAVDWVGEIMDVPNKADEVLLTLELTWNETVDEVIKVLPIGDALIPHIQCIDNITSGLPDLRKVAEFVVTVNASVNDMPDLSQFDQLSDNISYWLDKMQFQDLVELEDGMAQITASIDSIPVQLTLLKYEIEGIDRMKAAFPDQADIAALNTELEKIEHVQNDILTQAFVDEFSDQMDDPAESTAGEIAANIRKFQDAINVMTSINFTALDNILASFGNAKNLAPDSGRIIELINGLDTIMAGIDLDPIRDGLVSLNDSFNGLASEIDGIDPMLVELNETILGKIPSFKPLEDELGKINTTIAQAKCINNITEMIIRVNNSVIIMPYAISRMVVMLSNMTQTFQNDINFDSSLGAVTDMKNSVSGQLQDNIASMMNQSTDDLLTGLPDISSIYNDLEVADTDLLNGSTNFNASDILTAMEDMNDTLGSLEDVSGFRTSIADVESSIGEAALMNDSMNALCETLEMFPNADGQCAPICQDMKTTIISVKASSDAVDVGSLKDTISTFNDSMGDLPSASEYTDKISELNETVGAMPSLSGMETTISEANDTIAGLEVTGFSEYIDTFSGSLSGFDLSAIAGQMDRVSGIYDTFNQSNLLGQFNQLQSVLDPMINMIPAQIQSLRFGQLAAINDTFAMFNGWVTIVVEWKDMVLEDYVVSFDGYRLLAAFLLILVFVPCPCHFCLYSCCPMFGTICHFCNMCNLLTCACCLWILPVLGIPFSVGMESLCDGVDGALGNAVDELGNVLDTINATQLFGESASTIEELNVSMLFTDGFSSLWAENYVNSNLGGLLDVMPNMSVNASFEFDFETVHLKELLLNYIYDNEDPKKGPIACQEADILDVGKDVINSSIHALLNGFGDALLQFEFSGFRIHPKFPVTLKGIFLPAAANLTDVIDKAKPIMGCPALHSLYMILFHFTCERVRYGSIFLWGMLTICAQIFFCIACRGCATYCCFCCNYTSAWDKRKRNKMRKKGKKKRKKKGRRKRDNSFKIATKVL